MTDLPTRTFKLAADVLAVDTDDETLLLSHSSGKYVGLRGAVRGLLEKLREGLSFEDMLGDFRARYNVSGEEAACDLEAAVSKLVALGVIVESS